MELVKKKEKEILASETIQTRLKKNLKHLFFFFESLILH